MLSKTSVGAGKDWYRSKAIEGDCCKANVRAGDTQSDWMLLALFSEFLENVVWKSLSAYMVAGEMHLNETPHIQQYLQLRSEFMGYLYAITRDFELAEEVYQNAAVVVIEQVDKSETIRDFRAWAKEVVRRQALHAIRARDVESKHARAISPELLDVVSNAFLEDDSDFPTDREEARALRKCLDELPTEKRELVAMRYEGGAAFDEISQQTDSTPAAVQRALSRVRKLLHGCVQRRMKLAEGN